MGKKCDQIRERLLSNVLNLCGVKQVIEKARKIGWGKATEGFICHIYGFDLLLLLVEGHKRYLRREML